MRLSRRRFSQYMVTSALASSALPVRAQSSAAWASVVEAAKKEGTLTVYTGALGQTSHGKVAKAFEKNFDISVRFLEARASEIRERLRTEQAAGRFLADVSHDGSTTSTLQTRDNVFQPFGSLPNLARLKPPFAATDLLVPVSAIAYSIMVNSRLVSAQDEPRSWLDLTDPKWKGKLLCDDMRALGGGGVMFSVLQDKLGQSLHEKLALNQPVFTRDIRASEQRVARGEYPIWIPLSSNDILLMKGLPVKMIVPTEGMPYIAYDVGLLRNAPHPNAARVFMDFFLSPEAQQICAEEGLITATNLQITAAPGSEIAVLHDAKLLGTTDPTRMDDMLKLAATIYHS